MLDYSLLMAIRSVFHTRKKIRRILLLHVVAALTAIVILLLICQASPLFTRHLFPDPVSQSQSNLKMNPVLPAEMPAPINPQPVSRKRQIIHAPLEPLRCRIGPQPVPLAIDGNL